MSRRGGRQSRRSPGAQSGISSPLAIPGCVQLLDASLGITIATGVSAWADQSGNGNSATQGTGANQPTLVSGVLNGNPIVRFASPAVMTHPLSLGAGCTLWAVAKTNNATTYAQLSTYAGPNMYGTLTTALKWGGFYNVEASSGQTATAFRSLLQLITNFNNINFRTSGVTGSSSAGTAFPANGNFIGAATAAGTVQNFTGDIAIVGAWNRVLSTAECLQLESYSLSRFGV